MLVPYWAQTVAGTPWGSTEPPTDQPFAPPLAEPVWTAGAMPAPGALRDMPGAGGGTTAGGATAGASAAAVAEASVVSAGTAPRRVRGHDDRSVAPIVVPEAFTATTR